MLQSYRMLRSQLFNSRIRCNLHRSEYLSVHFPTYSSLAVSQAMHECTYTNQKHKKAKKWIDGFVQISGKSIVLYDEQRKRLYTTVSYKREDSEIDTPVYIIYSDELAAELDNGACPEAADEPSARVYERRQIAQSRITAAKPVVAEPFDYSAKQVEELEEETAERQDGPRPVGRSQEDILNLFSRK